MQAPDTTPGAGHAVIPFALAAALAGVAMWALGYAVRRGRKQDIAGSPPPPMHPPWWTPAFLRWQHTEISWWRSWRLALRALWAGARHRIYEYAAALPGQDDIVVVRAPLARFVIVRNPDIARHILVTHQDNYAKAPEYDLLAVAFGRGLVTDLDDENWQRNRRLVQPVFSRRQLEAFAPQMTAAAVATERRWRQAAKLGTTIDIVAEMNYTTMDIIARSMFGIDLTGDRAEQMRVDFARLLTVFGFGFMSGVARPLRWIATTCRRSGSDAAVARSRRLAINMLRAGAWVLLPRSMAGLRRIERFVDEIIAAHREGSMPAGDNLLSLLMAATDPETGYRYSDLEIRDELLTFLGAGFETTAAALSWTWYLLAQHPEARHRLSQELESVLAGRDPSAADVERLPWTQAVVAEAMRLYPPILGVARTARRDDMLGDYPLKAGTSVAVLFEALHHHDRIWDNPHDYDPARYLPDNLEPACKRATMPFGAGKRMCIASGFANLEAALVVATLAQRFELNLVDGQRVRRELTFTGGPDGALVMRPRAIHPTWLPGSNGAVIRGENPPVISP